MTSTNALSPGLTNAAQQLAAPYYSSSLLYRPLDLIMAAFFALHLFPSVVFAPQVALPHHVIAAYIPPRFQALLLDTVRSSGDPLLRMALTPEQGGVQREPWITAIFATEAFVQTPFFIYAVIALCLDWSSFRIPAIIYSSHVITTMIPILSELAWGRQDSFTPTGPLANTNEQSIRFQWLCMYAPFIIIPSILLIQQVFYPRDIARDKVIADAKAVAVRAELAASILRSDARRAAAALSSRDTADRKKSRNRDDLGSDRDDGDDVTEE